MDAAYFRSKYFIISLIAAVGVVAGGAGAYYAGGALTASWRQACEAPSLPGVTLPVSPQTQLGDNGARRTVTYAFNASAFEGGRLDLCNGIGEIRVEPATGDELIIEFEITARFAASVESTLVSTTFREDQGRLIVGAWEAERGESGGFFDMDNAVVHLTVRLPETGAYELRASTDVGDVHVDEVRVSSLHVTTDVGNVVATAIDLEGDATVRTDVGDAILNARSILSSNVTITADVGNAEAELPARADVGYDVHATTDVGEVVIRIGDTSSHSSDGDGPGETESARSIGYETKPVRVKVRVSTDVGNAQVVSA